MILELICGFLDSLGSPYALVGGRAVAFRGHPRLTVDFDFISSDRRLFNRDVWRPLVARGMTVDVRKGDFDDPLAGVIHVTASAEDDADVIIARWRWEAAVIERAERVIMDEVNVPVPRTSDLILLKLAAGGYLDLQDAYALLAVGDREQLVAEVEEHIAEVQPDVTQVWKQILSAG